MNAQAIGATENTLQTAVNDLDSLQALRRIVVLLESQACVDIGGRQRVTVDAFNAGASLANITSVTTVATVTTVSAVTNIAAVSGVDHHQFIDIAQLAYANAIRSKLN